MFACLRRNEETKKVGSWLSPKTSIEWRFERLTLCLPDHSHFLLPLRRMIFLGKPFIALENRIDPECCKGQRFGFHS